MPDKYVPGSQAGLPAHAKSRLAAMKSDATHKGLFTSDLSVNEFLLVKEAGFDPLGLVVGSSIYHIGWQKPALNQSMELETMTQAMYHARELAMTRMEEEADSLGADGIVGVRLDVGRQEWGEHLAEFIAIGTAIRSRDGQSHRAPNGRPFTSDLSGQDFWTLTKAGYRPVSFVMGNCVYHVGYQGVKQWFGQIGQNVEMPTYTQAIYDARELALARMQSEAEDLKADGIVGAQITEKTHGWGSHVIEYFAVGTSVIATRADHTIPTPQLILPLSDRPGLSLLKARSRHRVGAEDRPAWEGVLRTNGVRRGLALRPKDASLDGAFYCPDGLRRINARSPTKWRMGRAGKPPRRRE